MHLLYRLFGRPTAREYRISAERIRQLEAKALEHMKGVLDHRSLRGSRQLLRALLYLPRPCGRTSALQGRSNAA